MNHHPAADLTAQIRETVLGALSTGHDHPDLRHFERLVRDYPERHGKTLRGRIVVQSARAHGGDEAAALKAAAGVELFQAWVLVHDDIEDDSEERRGRPALHRIAGPPVAINVGDALHVMMWRLLMSLPVTHPRGVDRESILHEFLWMILRTAEGQHLDLTWVADGRFDISEADYLAMVTLKTAYYTVVSPLRLGAACAGLEPAPAFRAGGVDLGVAFQIRDDVLNLTRLAGAAPGPAYGKEHAGDLYEGKRTLIVTHLLQQARPDEASEVRRILDKPRSEKTPAEIDWLLAAIARHGSLGYAQGVAERRARRGLALVSEALGTLPGRSAARELETLLASLTLRAH